MEIVLVAVTVFLLGCLAVFSFKQYRKVQNRKAEEERARNERQAYEAEQARLAALKRQRDFEEQTYNDFLSRFESLKQDLELFEHANYGYLMKKDWEPYPSRIQNALSEIEGFPQEYGPIYQFNENADFLRGYYPYDAWFKDRNERFVEFEREHYAELFKNIDGKNLDEQQIRAVITDEFNNLIVAGAGSGKTLTVVGKIKYLVERWNVDPQEILVVSFSRKAVGELKERIERTGIKDTNCRTFHSLGLSQLGQVGVANPLLSKKCIRTYLKSLIHEHPDQVQAFLSFYGCYGYIPKDYEEFEDDGDRMAELKATDLYTLKGRLENLQNKAKDTLQTFGGEQVKSVEELMIANYLFLHGINYEYEKVYPHSTDKEGRAYQPDFYLTDYDIWLEHFGINEHGRVPWIRNAFEEQKYIDGIAWKRQVHAENETRLIESYSFWNKDQNLINKVEELLISNGVEIVENRERLVRIYEELKEDNRYLVSIVDLLQTFINLVKTNALTIMEIQDRAREDYRNNGYMWHRFTLFITFAEPILDYYNNTLKANNEIDFNDMINQAALSIRNNGIEETYKYIIVDEYQDTSMSRFNLIKAIKNKTDAKLICVGDDWQSIYRFAGSDISLFTNFGKYVGYFETLKIERTYRNSQQLIDVASKFIQMNPLQLKKTLRSSKHYQQPIEVDATINRAAWFEEALQELISQKDYSGKILVLGRYSFDLENLYPALEATNNIQFKKDRETGDISITYKGYSNISFMTVHKAKGLEADDVIVVNLVDDLYGFPNRVSDDPILQLLLDNGDDYEFAEERRLFYVALTRTKNKVYLLGGSFNEGKRISPFSEELVGYESSAVAVYEDKEAPDRSIVCPRCGTGILIARQNSSNGSIFVGCSNYPYCTKTYNQTELLQDGVRCPSCEGWMVRRKRRSDGKPFFGCSNYPDCKATIDFDEAGIH